MFVVDNHFDVCLPSVCKYFAENFSTCGFMSLRILAYIFHFSCNFYLARVVGFYWHYRGNLKCPAVQHGYAGRASIAIHRDDPQVKDSTVVEDMSKIVVRCIPGDSLRLGSG